MEPEDDEGISELWERLATVPSEVPPTAAMKARLEATLEGYALGIASAQRRGGAVARYASWFAAAAAMALIGVAIGRQTVHAPAGDSQIAQLRDEVRALREMTAIALLQQTSPSDRLRGISWTGQIEQPGHEVVTVLLDTLMRDPNVNVRLSTIDALKRFADRDPVRRGTLDALNHESSPLVLVALIDFAAEINGAEAVDALRRIANDPRLNEAARARAAAMLKTMG